MNYKIENFNEKSFPIYSSAQKRSGTVVNAHYHTACELVLICQGSPLLSVDTTTTRCRAGDLLFIPAFSVHTLYSEEECSIRGITFEPAMLDSQAIELDCGQAFARGRITEFCTSPQDSYYAALRQKFDALFDTYHQQRPFWKAEVLAGLYGVVAALAARYAAEEQNAGVYRKLQPAIAYLEKHFAEPITLQGIANTLNVCPDHAIRMFKEGTNKTPIRYLNDLRLTEAMKLLTESDCSVEEISVRTGFSNANYFSKAFKDLTKKSPLAYRKMHKKK